MVSWIRAHSQHLESIELLMEGAHVIAALEISYLLIAFSLLVNFANGGRWSYSSCSAIRRAPAGRGWWMCSACAGLRLGRFIRPMLIRSLPPSCPHTLPELSAGGFFCCHVEEPGAVGDLPHLPSLLSKLLNENQNMSCHLLTSSSQVTYKITWGCASASEQALKFQHVLRTRLWRAGKWKATQWSTLLSNLQD